MMGPEAALITARLTEMRRLGGYPVDLPSSAVPMYAEAAARARLEPFEYRSGAWARLRAMLPSRGARGRDSQAPWSVAAAPIAVKDDLVAGARDAGRVGTLLAALPLRQATDK